MKQRNLTSNDTLTGNYSDWKPVTSGPLDNWKIIIIIPIIIPNSHNIYNIIIDKLQQYIPVIGANKNVANKCGLNSTVSIIHYGYLPATSSPPPPPNNKTTPHRKNEWSDRPRVL
jgi:hypothetical protein